MIHKSEYELIAHSHLADCNMFLVEMFYRPLHLHKELELILVLRGTGSVTVQRDTFCVQTGDVLLFNSGEIHELHCVEGMLLLVMQISRSFCKRYFPQLRNLKFRGTNIGSFYSEAEEITECHLSHFLRDHLHITFQEYLCHLRIEAAMYLLKTTDLSVTTIAYECGFSDPKYLKQGFMRILNMTPQQWRSSGALGAKASLSKNEATMQRVLTDEESTFFSQVNFKKIPGSFS